MSKRAVNEVDPSSVNKSDNFADTVKTVGVVKSIKGLIGTIIFAVILSAGSAYLMSIGVPVYIGFSIIAVSLLIIIVDIIQLKRAVSVSTKPEQNIAEPVVGANEVLEDSVVGIRRYGQGAGSYSVLGTGKNRTPENTMLITNLNIWAVTIPLDGAGKIISDTDVSMWQWLTMKKDMESKFEEMKASMPLQELIGSCVNFIMIPRTGIAKVKTSDISQGITFVTNESKKYSYSIREKDDYIRLKGLLGSLSGNN